MIPQYSLTGDLLSFLTCGLQYRYQNKAALPPSTPVQLWFGEFIHACLEEAFRRWQQQPALQRFPWQWLNEVRPIEEDVEKRMRGRGMVAPPGLYCWGTPTSTWVGLCPDSKHPHQLIASRRLDAAINTWGQHLFPLISEAEVSLKGTHDMPGYIPGVSRSNYYGVVGIADVISAVHLARAPRGNLILHQLQQDADVNSAIAGLDQPDYEIIIDYKGMRRPAVTDPTWQHHEWQLHTYAWLRARQPSAQTVVAGILFYLNELEPSAQDLRDLQGEVQRGETDVMPAGLDLAAIKSWRPRSGVPALTGPFRELRSIRVVPVDDARIRSSLGRFDQVVADIEAAVQVEMQGHPIRTIWPTVPKERTCTACDFKTFCPNPAPRPYRPTVP
jgi:hypothetical protein